MTQKFKFGDRVRIDKGAAVFIFIEEQGGDAVVIHHSPPKAMTLPLKCLNLVPHPDTARLDWLEESCATVRYCYHHNSYDEVVFYRVSNAFHHDWFYGKSAREAIDAAMQSE